MGLIYMQSTIDYFCEKDPKLLEQLVQYGDPEIKEIVREDTVKYYKFKL
jgi:hypothetical protein|tara:strand:- start:10 stop:156 length:147 start_codon:yes stop_codon:yes gene_type:complete